MFLRCAGCVVRGTIISVDGRARCLACLCEAGSARRVLEGKRRRGVGDGVCSFIRGGGGVGSFLFQLLVHRQ